MVLGVVAVWGCEVRLLLPHLGLLRFEVLPLDEILELRGLGWATPSLSDVDGLLDSKSIVQVIKLAFNCGSFKRRGEVLIP